MLKPCNKPVQSGFSLIELLVGVAILGILASVAVPSFRTWILNTQIRNAAESISNGLQRARSEALKRNTNIDFVLSADSSWTIQDPGNPVPLIEQRNASDGSKNVSATATGIGTLTYTNLGAIAGGFTRVDVDSTVLAPADSNDLSIIIGIGGSIRMCNPNIAPPSPRAC